MNPIDFTRPDVWVLHAIALSSDKESATLRDILSAGDYINHAIFTWSELQTSLTKLLGAGCIESDGTRFKLGPNFAKEYARTAKRHSSIRKQSDALEVCLRALPMMQDDSSTLSLSITETDVEEAVKEYQQGFNKPARKRET